MTLLTQINPYQCQAHTNNKPIPMTNIYHNQTLTNGKSLPIGKVAKSVVTSASTSAYAKKHFNTKHYSVRPLIKLKETRK
jgi:hypothetical protein